MEKDNVQQGSVADHPDTQEVREATPAMSGGVATMGETSGSNVQGEEQRAVSGSQASDSDSSTIDPLPVGHTVQERSSSPASQRPAEDVSAEIVRHAIQSSEIRGASPSNTPSTHQDERSASNDSNNGSASTEHTVVQIAAPSVGQARNSSTPPMVVPIVNILPSTPSQNSMAETSAWGQTSRSSSPFVHAPPVNISMPAPQPIQPIYYAAPTPMYTTDASGAPIPFTASPAGTPPPVQYVVMPSASPPGSPGPYVQMINGQAMLVQPLPSPVVMPQPAPGSPPAAATTQSQPQPDARRSPLSNQPPQSRRSSDEVPPEVPPKPPALSRASTSATPHMYLPAPINHTITTHLNTPVPLQQPTSSDNIPSTSTNLEMPGAFPDQGPSSLPLHTPFGARRHPHPPTTRLSWDESVYDPPPSAQGRRTVASPLNSPILNIPPLTGIGSGAYPPFSPMDDGRGGGGNGGRDRERDGYFPAYTNGTGNVNGSGRADVRVPRRAYSQSSNGRQAISLNDPGPSNSERVPPSRVNSATYRRHESGVDLSQIPVRNSGLQDDTTSVTATSTRGFMALFPWMRARTRPEPKRQASELVDQLSGETREKTIGERLLPTLIAAESELKKAKVHAKATGWSLNIAIGAQVVLGALTTGVAAATTGRHTSIATTVLGGLSTLAASYLAKTRSSNEPEASAIRCQSLKEFVRDLQYLRLDRGHLTGHDWEVESFRRRFEDIMKNNQGGLKVMGEFMKEKVREHVQERVKEHVTTHLGPVDVPRNWDEATQQAYKRADEEQERELRRKSGGATTSGSGTTAAGGSKDVARREEAHEKPEVRRQSTQHG